MNRDNAVEQGWRASPYARMMIDALQGRPVYQGTAKHDAAKAKVLRRMRKDSRKGNRP